MFDARMRTTLAQRLVSIVSSVFDQTCFNRLDTHFNISMFGHQTVFNGVLSPNIYLLSRPLDIHRKFMVSRLNLKALRHNILSYFGHLQKYLQIE